MFTLQGLKRLKSRFFLMSNSRGLSRYGEFLPCLEFNLVLNKLLKTLWRRDFLFKLFVCGHGTPCPYIRYIQNCVFYAGRRGRRPLHCYNQNYVCYAGRCGYSPLQFDYRYFMYRDIKIARRGSLFIPCSCL